MGIYTVHDIGFSAIWSQVIDIKKFFHEVMRVAMHYCCLCTAYNIHMYMHVGGIRMLRNEEKQWELQVDHSLFAIKKLDITVSTGRVLDYYRGIACPWGGEQILELANLTRSWPLALHGRKERVDL